MLAIERNANTNTSIILHGLPRLILFFVKSPLISLSLDHEAAATSGDETFENGGEFFGDLLEGSLDGFVFALVKHVDKFLDRYLRCVEFFATFCQFVTLVGEVLVLLEGFFVYTFEAFELFIDFFEPFDNLDQINCCFNRCDGTNLPS
jgi:hypothetical protein